MIKLPEAVAAGVGFLLAGDGSRHAAAMTAAEIAAMPAPAAAVSALEDLAAGRHHAANSFAPL
ncbi:MAG: hypothetical protein ACLP8X_17025 [Streptosporangiaceae bacterium]